MIKEEKSKEYFKEFYLLKKISRFSLFSHIDQFLKDGNYPLDLTIEKYIILMSLALITAIYIAIDVSIKKAFILLAIVLLPFHLILYRKYVERRNKIQIALCDIQDIWYFQSKIGTPMDVILANAARIAKEPLKKPFEETASCYKITRNINKALNILQDTSNMMEVHSFVSILQQKVQTGFSEKNHKAQAIMMKRNKRLKKRLEREIRRNKLIAAAVLLFVCYVLMVSVPIFREVLSGFKQIAN